MDRYMIFSGDIYYPGGGMSDFWGHQKTFEAAEASARELLKSCDWAQIYDRETGNRWDYERTTDSFEAYE